MKMIPEIDYQKAVALATNEAIAVEFSTFVREVTGVNDEMRSKEFEVARSRFVSGLDIIFECNRLALGCYPKK